MEIIMETIKKRTANKELKGSKLFNNTLAVHMMHANKDVQPFVCDFTRKNKSIFFNILVPAATLLGCWYLVVIAMSLI